MSSTGTTSRSPVYQPLLGRIRQAIRNGTYRPGQVIGTERGLAGETGLSRGSIRRAIDTLIEERLVERRVGKGIYVNEGQAAKILIQMVVAGLEAHICHEVSRAVQRAGRAHDIQVQIYDAHGNLDLDIDFLRRLPKTNVDGAIIVAVHSHRFTEALFTLKNAGFPMVLVDQRLNSLEAPSVLTDNHKGGLIVGSELIRHGHRRVGLIGNLNAHTVRDRLQGLQDAFHSTGLGFDESLVMDLKITDPFSPSPEPVNRCVNTLLERADRPTAIFCADDTIAMRAYTAIKKMGLNIPQDVSVVGFDDSPFCSYLDPPLATVRQPFAKIGEIALEMLLKQLSAKKGQVKASAAEYRSLPPVWVPRGSVGPAPK